MTACTAQYPVIGTAKCALHLYLWQVCLIEHNITGSGKELMFIHACNKCVS